MMQKNRHQSTIAQLYRAISSQLRHISTIGKQVSETNIAKQQYLRLAGLGHPIIFQRVSRLGSVTARQSSSGRQPNFAALNRGRHLYSAGRPSRWALAHVSSYFTVLVIPGIFIRLHRSTS